MKHSLIAILFFCFISFFALSQGNTARIQEIKTMYTDIIQLEKSIDTSKQCKLGKKINYEGFDSNSEKYPFEQSASKCTFTKGYSTLTGNFSGYEWGEKSVFYYKNDALFFVFAEVGSESCFSEYRIYYDIKGTAIKILEKSNDCNGEHPTKNVEVMDAAEKKRLTDKINKDHDDILEMLK